MKLANSNNRLNANGGLRDSRNVCHRRWYLSKDRRQSAKRKTKRRIRKDYKGMVK